MSESREFQVARAKEDGGWITWGMVGQRETVRWGEPSCLVSSRVNICTGICQRPRGNGRRAKYLIVNESGRDGYESYGKDRRI